MRATLSRVLHILMKKPRPKARTLPPPSAQRQWPRGRAPVDERDFPRSAAILDRLLALHPKKIDLALDRILRLLADLGNPQLKLPPVIHVAGTNGKGSACAFSRAMLEAQGLQGAHPHLAASGALSRAHPHRRRADFGRGALRHAGGSGARQ